jgi:hypothetical protein
LRSFLLEIWKSVIHPLLFKNHTPKDGIITKTANAGPK